MNDDLMTPEDEYMYNSMRSARTKTALVAESKIGSDPVYYFVRYLPFFLEHT